MFEAVLEAPSSVDTEIPLYVRPSTPDQAQSHLDARECPEDHESVRLGSDGWLLVSCALCSAHEDDELAEAA